MLAVEHGENPLTSDDSLLAELMFGRREQNESRDSRKARADFLSFKTFFDWCGVCMHVHKKSKTLEME